MVALRTRLSNICRHCWGSSGPGMREYHQTSLLGRSLQVLQEKLVVEAVWEKLCAIKPKG